MREKIADLVKSPVIAGRVAYGGLSSSAGYILDLADGRRIFTKGNHPEEMAHGTANLRQEIGIYQAVPALKKIAPGYIGCVGDGDEDGWMLGILECLEIVPVEARASIGLMAETMAAWNAGAPPITGLDLATEHNYLRLFFNAEKKWRRLRDEKKVRERFTALFLQKDEIEAWLNKNLDRLISQQHPIDNISPRGLIHGDLRLDNFLFTRQRGYAVDWANACLGPVLFDVLFLATNLEGLGLCRAEEFVAAYQDKTGIVFNTTDMIRMLSALSGYFADQAYRDVPPKLPRLRWMQKCMLKSQLEMLARLSGVDSLPPSFI
jgi:hypothetical protein